MNRNSCIAIHGTRTNLENAEGWTERFVTWINTRLTQVTLLIARKLIREDAMAITSIPPTAP